MKNPSASFRQIQRSLLVSLLLMGGLWVHGGAAHAASPVRVVTTLSDYADLARRIGGDLVTVTNIVQGNQDAHFIRPKPSFVQLVMQADLLVETGLDLETWVPSLIDKSGNPNVRSGQPGYVSAATGMELIEKPEVMSRIEGGLHIYGNPHVTVNPLNMIKAAENIATGLKKVRPAAREQVDRRLNEFIDDLTVRLFGAELPAIIDGPTLRQLAQQDKLIEFLQRQTYQGKPLIGKLGGWLGRLLPYRGLPLVTYHRNWGYLFRLFGLREAGTIEPKPGIPPSPKHLADLKRVIRDQRVPLIMAANYFDRRIPEQLGAEFGIIARMVPYYVGGEPGIDSYVDLVERWVSTIEAAGRSGIWTPSR
jgi:ABC-type Zn uptake system ZnuABC Zn-binding protein ZnuA